MTEKKRIQTFLWCREREIFVRVACATRFSEYVGMHFRDLGCGRVQELSISEFDAARRNAISSAGELKQI